MENKVRVRFAPSPTGGLHLGGVRTALFNYLFAKKNNGKFILRIEDTDQTRFVEGAEKYIVDCLEWCGMHADESPQHPGAFGPYRQSERKPSYSKFALDLIHNGHAYYAFDTSEELEAARKAESNFVYNHHTRMRMKNSLTMSADQVEAELAAGKPHVIRILIPPGEQVVFDDMIRGEVRFDSSLVDDKVLLKADGMPTYHLAVVVDDHAMEISHVFRGEEWLPSAPVHIYLWKYLGWEDQMPAWAHLPLILKPDGNGKLSKRDGDRLGFPVYAMDWRDPKTGHVTKGFKELGFLPEAFNNLLAMLGWNDGTDQEIYEMRELIEKFSIERISKAGAKFDFEKAKWYNQQWIQKMSTTTLLPLVKKELNAHGIMADEAKLSTVISLVKDRCNLTSDFVKQSSFFFVFPEGTDYSAISSKWDDAKTNFFNQFKSKLSEGQSAVEMEEIFKTTAAELSVKTGELMLPFRMMLVGGKFGPGVFDIAQVLGHQEVKQRIEKSIIQLV